MVSKEEVIEAVEVLDGLQPWWYSKVLKDGPTGQEEYTVRGDDLGSMIVAIDILKEYFGIKENND